MCITSMLMALLSRDADADREVLRDGCDLRFCDFNDGGVVDL